MTSLIIEVRVTSYTDLSIYDKEMTFPVYESTSRVSYHIIQPWTELYHNTLHLNE